jgi:glucuronoarabinoxylan endo-1,4-beta-xylanase
VTIEDVAGRRIATVVNQTLEAGSHEVVWNGRMTTGQRAAPGVYFYRLVVDGDPSASKSLVLR